MAIPVLTSAFTLFSLHPVPYGIDDEVEFLIREAVMLRQKRQ